MTATAAESDSFSTAPGFTAVDVAVTLPLFTPFTYAVPEHLRGIVVRGLRVLVPFGARRITAYVLGPAERLPAAPLKPIAAVLEETPLFPERMVAFFKWIAEYYIHPLGDVMQSALPAGLNVSENLTYALTDAGRGALAQADLTPVEQQVLARLRKGPCRLSALRKGPAGAMKLLSDWQARAWVVRELAAGGARTRPRRVAFIHPTVSGDAPNRLSPQRTALLMLLQSRGPMALADLRRHMPTAGTLVRVMARDGLVSIRERAVYRDPFGESITPDRAPQLTAEQQAAVQTLSGALGNGFAAFLLAGVTGSGKTEIYLHLAQAALDRKRTVVVLVPEIALISQMERAFRARFGECVALLHSGLSSGERLDQWQRLAQGNATIAIGARSAIFAPLNDIGLIVVDEEHDDSYKQEGALRYNARDLAVVRARQEGALAVLGSATPSMQSAYNARIGKFQQVTLYERVDNRLLPEIVIEDLTAAREERGARRFLTPVLIEAIRATLERREQVLLFLNRRGFASTLVCADCGEPMRCDRCDISLTYHQQCNAYRCHYCGFSRAAVSRCGRCGSERIKRLGVGTEKLEQSVKVFFPTARVARMDRDTTRRKGAILTLLKGLRERRIDILVGTQMVAKGHDFPYVTLVGVICADLSLSMPDFRAGERTFQLLAQVAGRAGRGKSPGHVILQTYTPDHFSIAAARHHDFEAFYRQEIEFRKALRYPPFTRMIQIRISGRDKTRTAAQSRTFGERCDALIRSAPLYTSVEMLGPIEAPVQRVADHYRWQMLLKGPDSGHLHRLVRELLFNDTGEPASGDIAIGVDVDPLFLM